MAKRKEKDGKGRSQPGIDKDGRKNLDYIKENSEFFQIREDTQNFDDADIFRIAVAVTIKHNLKLLPHPSAVGSNVGGSTWSRDGLNTDPSLTKMVEILVPPEQREEIWTYIEQAAATGLKYMKNSVAKGKTLTEIIQ